MKSGYGTCKGCFWEDQCGESGGCMYYTPLFQDDEDCERYYEEILRENALVYEEFTNEQND